MTLMMDLVADTRRLAYGSMADQLNFLAVEAPMGAGELTMMIDIANITPGMVLSSGLNVYYVIGTEPSSKKVTVYQSYDNSMADALPVGSPVMIRPRVTDWLLFQNVNSVIKSMSSSTYGLYREAQWTDTTDTIWNTYDIPEEAQDMISLLRVEYRWPNGTDSWLEVPMNSVKLQHENKIIRLTMYLPGGVEIKFVYKAPFKQATSLTDDISDLGLVESMADIPPLGAAARLLRTTESRRNQTHNQSDPRRADEVQTGGNSQAAREFDREFRARVNDEYARLVNRYPIQRMI